MGNFEPKMTPATDFVASKGLAVNNKSGGGDMQVVAFPKGPIRPMTLTLSSEPSGHTE